MSKSLKSERLDTAALWWNPHRLKRYASLRAQGLSMTEIAASMGCTLERIRKKIANDKKAAAAQPLTQESPQ